MVAIDLLLLQYSAARSPDQAEMVVGLALIAWPAVYGDKGVMSFMTNREGEIYEADLGLDTGNVVSSMPAFDPDRRWAKVSPTFAARIEPWVVGHKRQSRPIRSKYVTVGACPTPHLKKGGPGGICY